MVNLQIIIGTTRPGRNSPAVGKWTAEIAQKRTDAAIEVVDLADYNLPIFNEVMSPAYAPVTDENAKKWSTKIAQADGYIFVTAEYNRSVPGVFKNAIDFLYNEWNNKAVGFVGYGNTGGSRAIEHLRGIAGELQLADVRTAVQLSLFTDFENMSQFKPADRHEQTLNTMLDQLISWSSALMTVREKTS